MKIIFVLVFRRNTTKKKKEGEVIEELTDPLALDQSSEQLVVAEVPITAGSPIITIIESLDGSLTSLTTSAASSLTTSITATIINTTTAVTALDSQSIAEVADKSIERDSETPVLIRESEDPASPNKSLSESSVKGILTPKKPKRDRKPKVKAIFPGKKNSK
jgi:hypothetical protein